jgi:hypothetical protein
VFVNGAEARVFSGSRLLGLVSSASVLAGVTALTYSPPTCRAPQDSCAFST